MNTEFTHNGAVMGELGRLPVFFNIMKSILRYIIHLDEVDRAYRLKDFN